MGHGSWRGNLGVITRLGGQWMPCWAHVMNLQQRDFLTAPFLTIVMQQVTYVSNILRRSGIFKRKMDETGCRFTRVPTVTKVRFYSYFELLDHQVVSTLLMATLLNPINRESVLPDGQFEAGKTLLRRQTGIVTPTFDADNEPTDEISVYFNDKFGRRRPPTAGEPESFDVLKFWLDEQVALPKLSALALELLSIPATSASVERQFSFAKLVMSVHRKGGMGSKTHKRSVYLRSNLDDVREVIALMVRSAGDERIDEAKGQLTCQNLFGA